MINKTIVTLSIAMLSLWLGSLACMQSAPSSPAHSPTKAKALELATATARPQLSCTVNTHALNVRDCGGFECSIIGWLEAGWIVKAEPVSGSRWIYITRGELSGFARADYLTCNSGE